MKGNVIKTLCKGTIKTGGKGDLIAVYMLKNPQKMYTLNEFKP